VPPKNGQSRTRCASTSRSSLIGERSGGIFGRALDESLIIYVESWIIWNSDGVLVIHHRLTGKFHGRSRRHRRPALRRLIFPSCHTYRACMNNGMSKRKFIHASCKEKKRRLLWCVCDRYGINRATRVIIRTTCCLFRVVATAPSSFPFISCSSNGFFPPCR
jgi:hypothetical protein